MFTGERHDGPVAALAFLQVVANSVEILDRAFDPVGDDHRPCLAADLSLDEDLFVEVVHHDLGLETDSVVVALDEAPQLFLSLFDVELRVVLHRLSEFVIARHQRVMRDDV